MSGLCSESLDCECFPGYSGGRCDQSVIGTVSCMLFEYVQCLLVLGDVIFVFLFFNSTSNTDRQYVSRPLQPSKLLCRRDSRVSIPRQTEQQICSHSSLGICLEIRARCRENRRNWSWKSKARGRPSRYFPAVSYISRGFSAAITHYRGAGNNSQSNHSR